MNDEQQPSIPPPVRVPTLTEVIDLPGAAPAPVAEPPAALPQVVDLSDATPPVDAESPQFPTERELTEQVLGEVQRQVDLMLEYRMREMLSPLLARLTDGLVREARNELASTLRDVVARAVAQELSRHRARRTVR